MPLRIAIIGAGICGLSTAIALQRLGHAVTVFEKSTFAADIGAAINLSPNGLRVLASLGFDLERARATPMQVFESVDGYTLNKLESVHQDDAEARYGAGFISIHRADLQHELLRLVHRGFPGTHGPPVDLRLGTAVEVVPKIPTGRQSGGMFAVRRVHDGVIDSGFDLVLGADGIHSATRTLVLGPSDNATGTTNMMAFRFTIPTSELQAADEMKRLREWKSAGTTVIADTAERKREKHLVWYACRRGQMQNIVAVYPAEVSDEVGKVRDLESELVDEFGHLYFEVVGLLRLAKNITHWDLPFFEPFSRWTNGNLLIIGDAAHPMQPFGAQGANQALEDAGALGVLLRDVDNESELRRRLDLFEQIRMRRTAVIQILSSARIGREETVADRLREFVEDGSDIPRDFKTRTEYALGFDILKECETRLDAHLGISEDSH